MTSVKVFPRLDKINKEGKAPIFLRITKNRRSKYISLDLHVFPKEWNNTQGKVKPSARNASQINTYIAVKVAEAERLALELETRSKFITATDIKARVLGKSSADFFAFARQREKIMIEELAVGTYRRFKGVLKKIRRFCKKETLYFDEIDVKFVKDYQQYLSLDLKNGVNTIHSNLKVFRKIINDAIAEELLPMEKTLSIR